MKTSMVLGAVVGIVALGSGCAVKGGEAGESSSAAEITPQVQQQCAAEAQAAANQFLLPRRQQAAYNATYAACIARNGGGTGGGGSSVTPGDSSDDLPLVRNRTRIASEVAARHLGALPQWLKNAAQCVAVISQDTVGWGLAGAGLGAGLVSCRTQDGTFSEPSYLSVDSFSLGPDVGFVNQDTTFVFTRADAGRAFGASFDITAGVWAVAGQADVGLSADTNGCVTLTGPFNEFESHRCTIALTDDFGLAAGADLTATLIRHQEGPLGNGIIGRNARVYGRGISVNTILTTPGNRVNIDVIQPWVSLLNNTLARQVRFDGF